MAKGGLRGPGAEVAWLTNRPNCLGSGDDPNMVGVLMTERERIAAEPQLRLYEQSE